MSRARCAAAALCAAAAVTGCGSRSSITLPVVTGGFGTDPLISLPTQGPPGGLVVRTLSAGPGPVVRPPAGVPAKIGHLQHQAGRAAS